MPKQYGGYQAPKQKTKVGDRMGGGRSLEGHGGVVTWCLSESDIREKDQEICITESPIESEIKTFVDYSHNLEEPGRTLMLLKYLTELIESKDYGSTKDVIRKNLLVKTEAEKIQNILNGKQETEGNKNI